MNRLTIGCLCLLAGLCLAAEADAVDGHPGAHDLEISKANGFGPRGAISGNPLADALKKKLEAKGARAMLKYSARRVFVAGFPESEEAAVVIGALSVETGDDKLVPIVVPRKGAKTETQTVYDADPSFADPICQYLGYEMATEVVARLIIELHCTSRDSHRCKHDAARAKPPVKGVPAGVSTVYEGESAISDHELGFQSWIARRGWPAFKGWADPLEVVVADQQCTENKDGRMDCPAFDARKTQGLYEPQHKEYLVINRLSCTNSNPRIAALVARAQAMVKGEAKTPDYERALAGYEATKHMKSPGASANKQPYSKYVGTLYHLATETPGHPLADKARQIMLDLAKPDWKEARALYKFPGMVEQMERDAAFQLAFYEKFHLYSHKMLLGVISDKSNANLGDKGYWLDPGKAGKGRGLDVFMESQRERLAPLAYERLAAHYRASFEAIMAGKPVPEDPNRREPATSRRKKAPDRSGPADDDKARRLRGQLVSLDSKIVNWLRSSQTRLTVARDADVNSMYETLAALRAARVRSLSEDNPTPRSLQKALILIERSKTGSTETGTPSRRARKPTAGKSSRQMMVRKMNAKTSSRQAKRKAWARQQDQRSANKRRDKLRNSLRGECSSFYIDGRLKSSRMSADTARDAKGDAKAKAYRDRLKAQCLARADRLLAKEDFQLQPMSAEWVQSNQTIVVGSCVAQIEQRTDKDLTTLMTATLYLDRCWSALPGPWRDDQEKKVVGLAKSFKRKIGKRIKGMMKDHDYTGAEVSAEEMTRLFGDKWTQGWLKKIAKAQAAYDRKQERLSEKARAKGAKACMQGLKGRFLCPDASKLICGSRCGHNRLCPCCVLTEKARKNTCNR